MGLRIKKSAISAVKEQMNIQCVSPSGDKHAWNNPVEVLFGEYKNFPDLLDFFADVSHKKGLRQQPLTLNQLFQLVSKSYDEDTNSLNPGMWKTLLGSEAPVEGSAYTANELNEISDALKEHYALVCVPTGFDWSARGINMKPLMHDLGLWQYLPKAIQNVWDVTILISIWVVYEALGLGGLNHNALIFHRLMRKFCSWGSLQMDNIPEELKGDFAASDSDYTFMEGLWFQLLEDNDLPPKWSRNQDIFELVHFLATGREVVGRIAKGRKLGDHLEAFGFYDIEPTEAHGLFCACQLLRDGAKGRLNLQDNLEKTYDIKGVLNYLLEVDPEDILGKLSQVPGNRISVAGVALQHQALLAEAWVTGRQEAKARQAEG
jgi:hypothetical protein